MTQNSLTAALIVVGNEILSGRTQDANTQWIAERMAEKGIKFVEVRIIPDLESAIIKTIHELKGTVDYLFTTGGIGPTHDDITTQSVAKAFGRPVVLNAEARDLLVAHYGSELELTEPRLKMAKIPEGAALIQNPVSAAPGFQIENVYVMAGVPRIMQAMLDQILATIRTGPPIISNTISCDMAESKIAVDLENIQNRYPTVEIGSYPHFRMGALDLSLVLKSTDNGALHKATREVIDMIRAHGGEPQAISIKSVEE